MIFIRGVRKKEGGQSIIAIVFVMMLALAVGVSISMGFARRLWGASSADSAYRAQAVAEAAVERILTIPNETLEDYVQFGTCGADCHLEIVGADGIRAIADVTLSVVGETSDPLPLSLYRDRTTEANLLTYPDGTSVSVCWDVPGSGEVPSVVGAFVYGSSGSYDLDAYSYNSVGSSHSDNGFDTAAPAHGYGNCFMVSGRDEPSFLRLRSVYNDVDAYVVPESGSDIPSQGILIESLGRVSGARKTVTVIKSPPYLPLPFDYVLFQKSDSEPLSN